MTDSTPEVGDLTWTELARRADIAAQNAGAREAERLMQRAADLALQHDLEEGPLLTNILFDRLMELATTDSWSGRGNDNARAYRDGFVAKARKIQNRMP